MGQLDASIVTPRLPLARRLSRLHRRRDLGRAELPRHPRRPRHRAVGRFADMAGRTALRLRLRRVRPRGRRRAGSPDLAALDGFRAAQGVGAAMLQANSLAIINLAVPGRLSRVRSACRGRRRRSGWRSGRASVGRSSRRRMAPDLPRQRSGGRRRRRETGLAFSHPARGPIPRDGVPLDWTGLALFVPAVAASSSPSRSGSAGGGARAASSCSSAPARRRASDSSPGSAGRGSSDARSRPLPAASVQLRGRQRTARLPRHLRRAARGAVPVRTGRLAPRPRGRRARRDGDAARPRRRPACSLPGICRTCRPAGAHDARTRARRGGARRAGDRDRRPSAGSWGRSPWSVPVSACSPRRTTPRSCRRCPRSSPARRPAPST